MGPSWVQMAPKIDLKLDPRNDHICDRSWDRFWEDFGPQLRGPGGSNESAVRHLFRFWCPLGAKTSPRHSNIDQKSSQEAPNRRSDGVLGVSGKLPVIQKRPRGAQNPSIF